MGLTIHYEIATPSDWGKATIRAKLEAARQYAKALPVVSVSDLAEFQGKDADFQHVREMGQEEQDEFFWAKIQAGRTVLNPWFPGSQGSQAPNHMMLFSVDPAQGSEQMNVGACWFPRHVWKARRDENEVPAWSLAFGKGYPESEKVIRAFLRKWNLRKLAASKSGTSRMDRFGGTTKLVHHTANGFGQATIQKGRYLSHRKGYAGNFGLLTLRDRMEYELFFRFHGSAVEAEKIFTNLDFQADLTSLVTGETHITPASTGIWASFVKTQLANDPRCGGWPNFAKCHLSVLALLEHLQKLGFKVEVRDEGGFWEKRDFAELGKVLGDYDVMLAGLGGAIKDAAKAKGMTAESAMDGRGDREQLEAKAQEGTVGEMLKKLKLD